METNKVYNLEKLIETIKNLDTEFSKVYRKEKISINKLKTADYFLNILKENEITQPLEKGNIYIFTYRANAKDTDKWHRLCITYVLEVKADAFIGFNLLYFNEKTMHDFLKHDNVASLSTSFMIHTRKEYFNSYILKCGKIEKEDWGKLPTLPRHKFGNINYNGLVFDWNKENTVAIKKIKEKKVKKEKEKEIPEEYNKTATEEINVFEEKNTTLNDIKYDLFFDEDDI